MSRIAISFSDKGREHLFRALAIVELLADHHELLLVAPKSQCLPCAELCRRYRRVELYVSTNSNPPSERSDSASPKNQLAVHGEVIV